ncbi:hypothetical protein OQZ29_17625 [Pedobacter agri]|uniref:DUF1351 domain-containing protein n=3 Tax=Pedobacter agri TaxID=454586 RepID=A0A9X3DF82_9SPHI|nr:hypothetical protein [Pedobacter agri]MCX3266582.1 hypothetical protein [Pedobacter agri]
MELQIITPEEVQSASAVLATTKNWVAAYQKKEAVLIAQADKEGIKLSVETDSAINDFLASLKKATKTANDARSPFTRRLDEIKGYFTAEENLLKGLETKLQEKRNASVKVYTQEKAEQARKDQLKLDQAKARIELFAEAEAQIRNQYAAILKQDKQGLLNVFEALTLDNIAEFEEFLKADVLPLTEKIWSSVNADLSNPLIYPLASTIVDELDEICFKAKEGKFEKVAPHYQAEIKNYADHLLSLIPERRAELEEGKASAAAEELRKEQEAAAQLQQQQSEQRQAEQIKTQVGAAVIDVQIEQAHRGLSIPKASAIESYGIEVLEQAGWSEIFKFYTTHCDKDITEKTTMNTMKLFAEAEAKRSGTIIESAYLHYEPKYKAVTRNTKKAA